jgi:hypothetical protein
MATPVAPTPNFPQIRSVTTNMGPDLANDRALTNPQVEMDAAAWNQARAEIQAIEASAWACTIQVQYAFGTYTITNCRGIPSSLVSILGTAGAPVVTLNTGYSVIPVMAIAQVCTPPGVADIAATVQRTVLNVGGASPTAITVHLSADASFVLIVNN